jgi:inosine/xanthosine triphosphate pyrophosphatase family protein
MAKEVKNKISHRYKALNLLREHLLAKAKELQ